MQDELTAVGLERWQALADEAARERGRHAIAPVQQAPIRAGLAAALVALAARLAPEAPAYPASTGQVAGTE